MSIDIKNEASEIVQVLANALKIAHSSLCFCGSGKAFQECCLQKSGTELTFMEGCFDKGLKYKTSQNGNIKEIPQGLFKQFEYASIARHPCLYHGCTKGPISSHLTPKNILRSCFGADCREYQMRDGSQNGIFKEKGINEAGALPVFCETHDNDLFKEVDSLDIDPSSLKQQFLMAFKAISFSLRTVQYLLGIDSQVALFEAKLILENQKNPPPASTNFQVDISHLQGQYMRFVITHAVFKNVAEALEKDEWAFFSYFNRSLDYSDNLFFAGFINPSHDLNNERLNKSNTPINMTCNIFTRNKKLHVLLAAPHGESKEAYTSLFNQLKNTDDKTFIKCMNNFITISGDQKPLLPKKRIITENDIKIMIERQKWAEKCIKLDSKKPFILTKSDKNIDWIKEEYL